METYSGANVQLISSSTSMTTLLRFTNRLDASTSGRSNHNQESASVTDQVPH